MSRWGEVQSLAELWMSCDNLGRPQIYIYTMIVPLLCDLGLRVTARYDRIVCLGFRAWLGTHQEFHCYFSMV